MTQLSPPTVRFRAVAGPSYHRPDWVRAVADQLPECWRGPRADLWIGRAPVLGVLAVFVGLTLLLRGTAASTAEVELIRAGLSPYSVAAAWLDHVGGLGLVRAASLVGTTAAIALLAAAVRSATGSARQELLTAAVLATTPALLVAATTSATTAAGLLAIAAAVRLGAGRSIATAAGCGVALAVAAVLVPASLVLVPAVVALLALLRPSGDPVRPLTSVGVLAVLLGTVLLVGGRGPFAGILAPDVVGGLRGLAFGALPAALLAIGGAVVARSGSRFRTGAAVLAALVLPMVATWSGTAPTAYPAAAFAALLLAPVAGRALAHASRRLLRWVPVVAVLLVLPIPAVAVARTLSHGWVDVRPAAAVAAEPGADQGRARLSDAAESLAYAAPLPAVRWVATAGPDPAAAVAQRRFSLVLLSPSAQEPALVAALDLSADYVKDAPLPDANDPARSWTVYRLIDLLP